MDEKKPYEKKTYYAMTLDPVHIGTGGYRLGRVDNTITREPGTNLPKIPGTGISGVARAFTAMMVEGKYQRDSGKKRKVKQNDGTEIEETIYYSCAGKGADDGEGHCGDSNCPVCVSFGFSKKGNSFQGMTQFFDARILFFPVYSMLGPVWVTSCSMLQDFQSALKGQSVVTFDCDPDLIIDNDEEFVSDWVKNEKLNLGWLYLKNSRKIKPVTKHNLKIDSSIIDRLVVVSDNLFSRIVNDNLEVRTSVAINPETGAAEDGALYTYEAIPRATVLWFDVVYNKPENFQINGKKIEVTLEQIKTKVEDGLKLIEFMGVGGMNTRGMGRMRILNLKEA